MKNYFVEGFASWFVVKAKNARAARSEGIKDFGRGSVKSVRLATKSEVESFIVQKGELALEA